MSITTRGLGARRRALAILTAGALAAGVSATTATANPAEPAPDGTASAETVLGAGRYVVLLNEPGATRYGGGINGLAPTKAPPGDTFAAGSDKVKQYARFLERKHGQVAGAVGADVLTETTIASNSFTAQLTAEQATELAADRDVLMLTKDTAFAMDTWNTPRFLGLESASGTGTGGVWAANGGVENAGQGVVVGILDSGIWPESESFAGAPLKTRPSGKFTPYRTGTTVTMKKADGGFFRGECETSPEFTAANCNEKLIGARAYPEAFVASVPGPQRDPYESLSPRDGDGHGSHTAGTAAGNFGVTATVEGRSFGKVSGMAPAAKIAAYKVCFNDTNPNTGGCYTSSTLDAVDDAITDGVDVINYSISGATDTVVDAVEYAFLGAAAAGVFVAASAGNSGPTASTVAHNSPWVTTVAASTHAVFENTVVLGNNTRYKGASINSAPLASKPLVLSTSAGLAGKAAEDVRLCAPGSLDPTKVTGKVVICDRGVYDRVAKSGAVKTAGGVGMVLTNTSPSSLDADFHAVPTVHVDEVAGAAIKAYVASTAAPTAAFEVGDTTGGSPTVVPQIAGFSSRGPAIANDSDVIKPDITGPGVSVLAAVAPPSGLNRKFDLYSGTSMSSPHIAGLAAFILGRNPKWSPMTVKSAMMTTAYDLKKADGTADTDPFAQGAGHVDPKKFFNPGLVVTSDEDDWLSFMNGQGAGFPGIEPIEANALNTPSIAQGQVAASTSITRTFTGLQRGTWNVAVNLPGFEVTSDKPSVTIKSAGQSVPVTFTFTRTSATLAEFAKGFVTLTGPTTVRMPVALRPVAVKAPASVAGTGADGTAAIDITAGFTGDLDVKPSGLAKATTVQQSIAVGAVDFKRDVTIADGTKVARFVADAANNAADLDLFVYRYNAAGTALEALVGQSATGSADETVTLVAPMARKYQVVIDGYAAAPGETAIATTYDEYLVDATATLGSFHAEPDPVAVKQGETASYDAVWSGLTTGRYLGMMEYDGALSPTYVTVSVP